MRIAVACDHAGFPHKAGVVRALEEAGHRVVDFGTHSTEPVDYPDYARVVGHAVRGGAAELGVLICGSGAGVAIAANKIRGVRAALCHDAYTARQSREDDDANVICLGARVLSLEQAIEFTRIFVGARFSGAERHTRRLAKILALEREEAGAADVEPAAAPSGVAAVLRRLAERDAAARIWRRDASLWSDEPAVQASIRNRLGWLDAPAAMRLQVADLARFADELRRDGFTDAVLLGMGGSSLAAEVLAQTFPPGDGALALSILDTTDPAAIRAARERLKLARTVFIVSSKSGTTIEMVSLYRFFRAELEREVDRPGDHCVAITDAGTPLERLAAEARFRRTFVNPADIGGRFSALSYFGLVPGALAGVDIAGILDRAHAMAQRCAPDIGGEDNPGLRLGAELAAHAAAGRDKVTLLVSAPIRSLGAWLEQLLTESTGKLGRGLVVVHDEPPGPPDIYGDDRLFVAITVGHDTEIDRVAGALEAAGHPVVRLALADRLDLGAEFFRWEFATAVVGALLGLNPFDEPNVAQAKDATQAALATFKERGRLPEWPADRAEDLGRVLASARPGDYVALLAYLTPEPATTAALQALRLRIRELTRLATTVGYGPRYLHSTGQLHKGGPPTPILVVLTVDDGDDVPIPGERYGFGTLKMAQALGDIATLRAANRRVLWLPLAGAPAGAIERLRDSLARTPA
jgi:RpiB/LacA/LacB family sugar-phosphate isomerase